MTTFWLCVVPLFVAVDALGALPIFMSLTEHLGRAQTRRVIRQSVVTALAVALVFLAIGRMVLALLKITVADFMIAAGLLLFGISLAEMFMGERRARRVDLASLGAVPLGVPLLVGPAVLATTMLLVNEHGLAPTVLATVANLAFAGVVFRFAEPIHRCLGKAGTRTISKLASLILASIGVMMVRKGVMAIVLGAG